MRDFNTEYRDVEGRDYSYGFDDRMRHFMWRTYQPFLRQGPALEMGCFLGEFTSVLAAGIDDDGPISDLDVVEGSDELIGQVRARVGTDVRFFHSMFETFTPDRSYADIFLMHALEHVDDAVGVLDRARRWLAPDGRLFVMVPNADAPSRQIAVRMGLISHNEAVTAAEHEHGHRRTYSLDTLERDATEAGLSVVHRGGVMFKALANFQFDRALEAGIIDDAYLEGCYALGMQHPTMCASVFVVCEASGSPGVD